MILKSIQVKPLDNLHMCFLGLCSVLCFKAPTRFPAILAARHDCFSKSPPAIQTEKPQRLLNGLQRNVIRSWFPEDES